MRAVSLTKRGKYWHFDFWYKKKRYQGSTDQTNINKAKLVEAKVRSDAALEAFGIAPPKDSPNFKEFMTGKFLDHVRVHNKTKPRTVAFYEEKAARLALHAPFVKLRLSDIDAELISDYGLARVKAVAISTANGEIRTLRKALNLAKEWGLIQKTPKIRTLPGETVREFILDGELENLYLSVAPYPLKHTAILILDFGLRPEECLGLKKADVTDDAVVVWTGKTKNAARSIPQTERSRAVIEELKAAWPKSEWLFPGRKGKHYSRKSLDNLHTKIRTTHKLPAEFVLYSLRHTFGSRLAEVASPFDVKAAMGHGDIRVTQRYVHPTDDHLRIALKRKEALDKMLRGEVPAIVPVETKEPR